ncbi:CHAT domain-containing protein [Mycena leptocephala]|nr:CHAT domain-containing protein [Mycena leptocephala]
MAATIPSPNINSLSELRASANIPDLNRAIYLFQARASKSPEWPRACQHQLAKALITRFLFTADLSDHYLAALESDFSDVEDDGDVIMSRASELLNNFYQSIDAEALNRILVPAAARYESAVDMEDALLLRFHKAGNVIDLVESMDHYERTHNVRPHYYTSLCAALLTCAVETPDLSQCPEALHGLFHRSSCLRAVRLCAKHRHDDDVWKFHRPQFRREQLELAKSLMSWGHPRRPYLLDIYATAFQTRFHQNGDPDDIEKSLDLFRESLAIRSPYSPHSTHRDRSLSGLGSTLMIQFEKFGHPEALEEGLELLQNALVLRPFPHPDRGSSLMTVATALQARFKETSNSEDLTEAIQLHWEALKLLPDLILSAVSMHHLDEAVTCLRDALKLPSYHAERLNISNNLANTLRLRFEQTRNPQDLDEAIALNQKVLELLPKQIRDLDDIGEAIRLHQQALNYCPILHELRPEVDFTEVILLEREALSLVRAPHPQRGVTLVHAAGTLLMAHEHHRKVDYVSQAFEYLQEASTSRYPHSHPSAIDAYRGAIALLPQVAALYLDVQSRMERLTRKECINVVSNAANCAIDLGKYDVAVEFLETSRSVFWSQARNLQIPLESLRCAGSRGSQLATKLSELSKKLHIVSFTDDTQNHLTDPREKVIAYEADGVRCRRLNQEWEDTINSVGSLPGFADFLQPRNISTLRKAAARGPVVILVPGKSSSHALVVSQEVQCVTLDVSRPSLHFLVAMLRGMSGPRFDMVKFTENLSRGQNDQTLTRSLNTRIFAGRETHEEIKSDHVFGLLLSELWHSVVKPVLAFLNIKKSSTPSRIWWCPTGLFTFLPIHAAGVYEDSELDCTFDYVVSSYTPTLAALLDPPTPDASAFKMTAVIQPQSMFSRLPATRDELEKIKENVPAQWLTALGDVTEATAETALLHLQQSSLVHFAGHGVQDSLNPLDSGLVLTDGLLKVSEVMRRGQVEDNISPASGKGMSLAFLSACETAKGDVKVPDEAVHLAATLLFAGFRGVVATMWSMQDIDGPKIAEPFYKHLFRNCNHDPSVPPDLREAADALHIAVGELRAEANVSFMRWVPFVHYGL